MTEQHRPTVVHLTTVHPHDDNRILYKQCTALAQAGLDVALVVRRLGKGIVPKGVRLVTLPNRQGRCARLLASTLDAYRTVRALNPGVVHFHDPELIPVCLIFSLHGMKVVYDVHEDISSTMLYKEYLPRMLRPVLAMAGRAFERLSARAFDAVVTATPPIQKMFHGAARSAVVVQNFPLSEEVAEFGELPEHAPKTSRNAVYIGSITRARGALEMLDALALASADTRLILGGKVEPPALLEELASHPAWHKVDYRGVLTRPQVIAAMKESAIGLVMFRPEQNYLDCYPTKLFEYMAAGIPVVVSDFPLWRQIVGEAECGVCVSQNSAGDVACAIDLLLSDTTKSAEMGERGRSAVRAKYSWETEKAKLVSLYRQLVVR